MSDILELAPNRVFAVDLKYVYDSDGYTDWAVDDISLNVVAKTAEEAAQKAIAAE